MCVVRPGEPYKNMIKDIKRTQGNKMVKRKNINT